MESTNSKLFTPVNIGPITLRNRTIRAAAFEGMATNNSPSEMLFNYHKSVAEGGVGMTNIAYASVTQNGLSFTNQLWMRPAIIGSLHRMTDAIHAAGAKASIQLGHCGNMSHRSICGETPLAPCSGFNLYSPTFTRGMRIDEIKDMAVSYGEAVRMARDAGMDCVEIHAGHGYLISQFLSPYTNKRKDEYGGDLDHRMRFMREAMNEVMKAAGSDIGVVVKTNMRDGFKSGNDIEEGLIIAKELQNLGAHALVLSGGFVSKAPMYVMRGAMPIYSMTYYMKQLWLKYGVRMVGNLMIPKEPFSEAYFLDDALVFRREMPDMPLIYVGGLVARKKIDEVLDHGFVAVQMARALLNEPDFVNRMKNEGEQRCSCDHVNYCIARMYSREMACHKHLDNLPPAIIKEIEKIKKNG